MLIERGLSLEDGQVSKVPIEVLLPTVIANGAREIYCVHSTAAWATSVREAKVPNPGVLLLFEGIPVPDVKLVDGVHVCTWSSSIRVEEFDVDFLLGMLRALNPRAGGMN
ncbi:hypothetical protein DFR24_2245 [Panacagrimonas perspica]|uniref:Uncharacterized protein n=1 Tax=Panacagrimonas perspica TaxID=381431 RepID=A0A4R7PFD4_9GAMM|nr:hypothetical protein [Panacagrimonas perspica]TDU32837.1 hypothetical protein DFR24_2245 [Panacagrimonas perspica]THD00953.1 hypothetical protein B1810_22090 [Panacagrimonas perspica]